MLPIEKQMAAVLKALAHPTRLGILTTLKDHEELCVCHIYEELNLEQSNISQHLKILRDQGVVESRREGTKIMYRVTDPQYITLLSQLKDIIVTQMEETLANWKG